MQSPKINLDSGSAYGPMPPELLSQASLAAEKNNNGHQSLIEEESYYETDSYYTTEGRSDQSCDPL